MPVARARALARSAIIVLLSAAPAAAQPQQPVSGVVVDLRGVFARHKQEPDIARQLDVVPANLPTKSFGLTGGAHVYPLHVGKVAIGFGGHVLFARGSHALEPGKSSTPPPAPSPVVKRHFTAFAPEVSFNFGHRNGWSFISGGIGRTSLYVDREDTPASGVPTRQLFHYGAGARWFTNHHVAVSLEIRWYSVAPLEASATYIGQPRTTLMLLGGGIAIR
jgi:hypothetical protein